MKHVWKSSAFSAIVLFSFGMGLAFLFSSSMVNLRYVTGYWLGVTAQSGLTLIVSAGIAAIGGAIEGSRLKSTQLNQAPHARKSWHIAVRALWPVFVAAISIQVLSFLLLSTHAAGATDSPNLLLVLAFLTIVMFHLLLGFNLGLRLAPAISIPIALICSYFWLGSAWAVNYFPLRYMSGLILMDCCRIYETLDTSAILTAITFNGCGAIAFAIFAKTKLVYSKKPKTAIVSAAVLVAVAAFAVSANLSSALGPVPVVNRSTAEMKCSSSRHIVSWGDGKKKYSLPPKLCFFPGQDPSHRFAESLDAVWSDLERLGLRPPKTILATNVVVSANKVGVVATPVSRPAEVGYSLVSDFVGQPVVCDESDAAWIKRDLNYRSLINFLLRATSHNDLDMTGFAPPLEPSEGKAFESQFASALAFARGGSLDSTTSEWLKHSLEAVRSCDVKLPAGS